MTLRASPADTECLAAELESRRRWAWAVAIVANRQSHSDVIFWSFLVLLSKKNQDHRDHDHRTIKNMSLDQADAPKNKPDRTMIYLSNQLTVTMQN